MEVSTVGSLGLESKPDNRTVALTKLFSELSLRVDELKNIISDKRFEARITHLELKAKSTESTTKASENAETIETLKKEYSELKTRVDALSVILTPEKVTSIEKEIHDLTELVKKIQTELTEQSEKTKPLSDLPSKFTILTGEIDDLKFENRILKIVGGLTILTTILAVGFMIARTQGQ